MNDMKAYIESRQAAAIVSCEITRGELVIAVKRDSLRAFLLFLKSDGACAFTQLTGICGADYPERAERFEVVYQLLSMRLNARVRVTVTTDSDTPLESVADMFAAAGWYERETFDMYGVVFEGNADLRRILTDYGFEGHPLRKDFPLTGFYELHYDEATRDIVKTPVQLQQDYRNFDFVSPWEAMTGIQQRGESRDFKPKISVKQE